MYTGSCCEDNLSNYLHDVAINFKTLEDKLVGGATKYEVNATSSLSGNGRDSLEHDPRPYNTIMPAQRAHDALITSLRCQNDVATSF